MEPVGRVAAEAALAPADGPIAPGLRPTGAPRCQAPDCPHLRPGEAVEPRSIRLKSSVC